MIFNMRKERCGLCGGKIKENSGVMQYRAENADGQYEMFSMAICKDCCDDLDKEHQDLDTKEVREFMMRKL